MYTRIAIRNLRQGGRRTRLLGVALALVAGLLIQLLSLSNGVNDIMVEAATTLSAGHINVAGFYKAGQNAPGAPIVTSRAELRSLLERETPGLSYIIDRHRGWAKAVSDTGSLWAGLYGLEIEQEVKLVEKLKTARTRDYLDSGTDERPGDLRRLSERDTVAMFASQAKRLRVQLGDQITLRTETLRGTSNTTDLTVVAILEDLGILSSWNLLVPKRTILELYGLQEDSTGAIMLYLENIEEAPQVMAELSETLSSKGYSVMEHDPRPFFMKFETVSGQDWTGQKLDLTTWDDEVSFFKWIITAIDGVSFLLVAVLAVIIALGIMNALWISVRERTREIGTLRAIGMSRGGVLKMILLEAAILGAAGSTVGALMSAGFSMFIDSLGIKVPIAAVRAILMSDNLHFVVEPSQVALTIISFTLLCALSSIWPAMRAANMRPITAIQTTE